MRMGSHRPNHFLKIKIKITSSWNEQLFDGRPTSMWSGVEQFSFWRSTLQIVVRSCFVFGASQWRTHTLPDHDVERRGPFRVLTDDVGLHVLYRHQCANLWCVVIIATSQSFFSVLGFPLPDLCFSLSGGGGGPHENHCRMLGWSCLVDVSLFMFTHAKRLWSEVMVGLWRNPQWTLQHSPSWVGICLSTSSWR